MKRVLVIGGDSMIGGALLHHLAAQGVDVTATTRRKDLISKARPLLDLAGEPESWPELPDADTWVIAGAVARLADCRNDPVTSRRVNVDAVAALCAGAAQRGAHLIFLSTDKVFDGTRAHQRADAAPSPRGEYGAQKAAAEVYVHKLGQHGCVVRLTKVLDPQNALICGWISALGSGTEITPFEDMTMAPVALATVVETLSRAAQEQSTGIIQISGPADVSYADAACHIAQRLGADARLLQVKRAGDVGMPPEDTPPHTTLDTSRLAQEFGIQIPAAMDLLDQMYLHSEASPND